MANRPNRVGQQLGNYRLLRLLGQGGFAEVYLGEHTYLGSHAAIKLLYTRVAQDDIAQFQQEARMLANLVHPHIVRVLDFGVDKQTPYLVMDYAAGGTLRTRHPKGTRLAVPTVVAYVKQCAQALQYAHDQKLIHRDIKPENMLIARNGDLLLSDFGIALIAQSSRYQTTKDMAGTIAYMAPEQIEAHPRPASDQYSLGIVVYEWLSGNRPFQGSFTEIAIKHSVTSPPSLRQQLPTLSPEIEQIVFTALAKKPEDRFASVRAFATALEQSRFDMPTVSPHLRAPQPLSQPSSRTLPIMQGTITPPNQPSPVHSEQFIPPTQLAQPPTIITPPSQTVPSIGPRSLQLSQHHISRRVVLIGGATIGIGLAVGGVTMLANTLTPTPSTAVGGGTTLANTATPTPSIAVGTRLNFFEDTGTIRALAWSRDGKFIAAANDDYAVPVWDVNAKKLIYTYRGHLKYVEGVSWSPDGKYIVSGSADGTARIWNVQAGETRYVYTGHTVADVGTHHPWVNRVQWSPDGTRIVSCDQTSSGDLTATVQVWDANTGKTFVTYSEHKNGVYSVAWSPDNKYIASVGYDGTLRVWEATAPAGKTLVAIPGSSPRWLFGVVWSPDSKHVAFGGSDYIVWVISLDGQQKAALYTLPFSQGLGIRDLAWSPKGKYIAVSTDGQGVHIIKYDTDELVYKIDTLVGDIAALGWSPTESRIASGNGNGTGIPYAVQVWQAPEE